MLNSNSFEDVKNEYFASYGDYSNIYNEPMNFIDRSICELIISDIRELEPNTIFTFNTYLDIYQITGLKDRFKFTYELLKALDGIVILPRSHVESFIAIPINIPYLKIK